MYRIETYVEVSSIENQLSTLVRVIFALWWKMAWSSQLVLGISAEPNNGQSCEKLYCFRHRRLVQKGRFADAPWNLLHDAEELTANIYVHAAECIALDENG
jgi:hypothetical protein